MSEEAIIAQKGPYKVELVKGETCYWCACGRSKNQPFCDGSHQGTSFEPVAFRADKTGSSYWCGCKHSNSKPVCDGSHNSI